MRLPNRHPHTPRHYQLLNSRPWEAEGHHALFQRQPAGESDGIIFVKSKLRILHEGEAFKDGQAPRDVRRTLGKWAKESDAQKQVAEASEGGGSGLQPGHW